MGTIRESVTAHDQTEKWAAGWATAGAAAWAVVALLAGIGRLRIGVVELLFLFAPLVIVPLGMELKRRDDSSRASVLHDAARNLQPLGALLAVLAMYLPAGITAGSAALGWMAVCSCAALAGAFELSGKVRRWHASSEDSSGLSGVLADLARLDLAVGGAWFVASRFGMRPLGIQEPIGLLTAVHFHYAGFATAMIASAMVANPIVGCPTSRRFCEKWESAHWMIASPTLRLSPDRALWLRRTAILVAVLPLVVAAGFVISPLLKMSAAVLFSFSVAVLAIFMWKLSGAMQDSTARVLARISATTVLGGMFLSATYAVSDFLGSDALTIPRMATIHGMLNAFGFCLLGLLAWLIEFAPEE